MLVLEGEELRSVLSSHEALPVELALDIGAQVADGLAYAHDRHIVHRDIKPANIMVTPAGDPVILDFGVARDLEGDFHTLTQSGELFGSPAYMAAEQERTVPFPPPGLEEFVPAVARGDWNPRRDG